MAVGKRHRRRYVTSSVSGAAHAVVDRHPRQGACKRCAKKQTLAQPRVLRAAELIVLYSLPVNLAERQLPSTANGYWRSRRANSRKTRRVPHGRDPKGQFPSETHF
jgi:hypothetical protein